MVQQTLVDTVKAQGQAYLLCPKDLHGTAISTGHGLTMSCLPDPAQSYGVLHFHAQF